MKSGEEENPSCFIAASWVMVEWCVGPVADACASMLCVPVWILGSELQSLHRFIPCTGLRNRHRTHSSLFQDDGKGSFSNICSLI